MYRSKKYTIEEMQNLAKERGGECLSNIYEGCFIRLEWKCINNHKWKANPAHIVQGSWCPYCTKYKEEEKCRFIFEKLTEKKFPRVRPVKGIELDGYCEELKLAFEYNGKQHYVFTNWVHKTQSDFEKQQKTDATKKEFCNHNNINFMVIPYNSYKNDQTLLNNICRHLNITPVPQINILEFYQSHMSIIKELQEVAKKRGGELLSDFYVNSTYKLKWRCKEGHEWEGRPVSIKCGRWCPKCGGTEKLTIQHAKKLAKSRNGECLSIEYKNSTSNLIWKCENGHVWEAGYGMVNFRTWCPYCSNNVKKTIDDIKGLAHSKGGQCLSDFYTNTDTKLKWQCSKGHMWEASAHSVKGTSWCPYCSGMYNINIEIMQEFAKNKKGKCLTTKYINSKIPMLWECENGHTFEKKAEYVKQGYWCHLCSKRKKLSIEDAIEYAKKYNGICLSTCLKNSKTKLQFKCQNGHIFSGGLSQMKQYKQWCGQCKKLNKTTKTVEAK